MSDLEKAKSSPEERIVDAFRSHIQVLLNNLKKEEDPRKLVNDLCRQLVSVHKDNLMGDVRIQIADELMMEGLRRIAELGGTEAEGYMVNVHAILKDLQHENRLDMAGSRANLLAFYLKTMTGKEISEQALISILEGCYNDSCALEFTRQVRGWLSPSPENYKRHFIIATYLWRHSFKEDLAVSYRILIELETKTSRLVKYGNFFEFDMGDTETAALAYQKAVKQAESLDELRFDWEGKSVHDNSSFGFLRENKELQEYIYLHEDSGNYKMSGGDVLSSMAMLRYPEEVEYQISSEVVGKTNSTLLARIVERLGIISPRSELIDSLLLKYLEYVRTTKRAPVKGFWDHGLELTKLLEGRGDLLLDQSPDFYNKAGTFYREAIAENNNPFDLLDLVQKLRDKSYESLSLQAFEKIQASPFYAEASSALNFITNPESKMPVLKTREILLAFARLLDQEQQDLVLDKYIETYQNQKRLSVMQIAKDLKRFGFVQKGEQFLTSLSEKFPMENQLDAEGRNKKHRDYVWQEPDPGDDGGDRYPQNYSWKSLLEVYQEDCSSLFMYPFRNSTANLLAVMLEEKGLVEEAKQTYAKFINREKTPS